MATCQSAADVAASTHASPTLTPEQHPIGFNAGSPTAKGLASWIAWVCVRWVLFGALDLASQPCSRLKIFMTRSDYPSAEGRLRGWC